jgi:transcriptional regulator with XRE-family HTH domain
MESQNRPVHPTHMANPRHFLREWRESKDLTLEQVAERIGLLSAERADAGPEAKQLTMTHATLSRIERGLIPYGQYLLEYLAEIYQTDPGSLIMRDPSVAEAIWTIWERLRPAERRQVEDIARTFEGRTGTDG